jgi:hypothetical protein
MLEVDGVKSRYFAGSEMEFDVGVKNLSGTEKCFSVDFKIKSDAKTVDFPKRFFILGEGDRMTNKYVYSFPENFDAGNYKVELELKDKTVDGDTALAKRILPFKVKRKPVKPKILLLAGNIKFTGLPKKINFSDRLVIKALVKNTAGRRGKFHVKVKLTPPPVKGNKGREPKILTRMLNLNKKSQESIKFKHRLPKDMPDGKYRLTVQLFEKGATKLLSSDKAVVSVIDRPPEIVFKDIGLSVKKGEQAVYKVRVVDDKGVKSVRYYRHNLKTGYTTSYMMTLTSGNNSKGIWSYSADVVKKTRKFKFYVAAIDTKNQKTKTDEYSVAVLR